MPIGSRRQLHEAGVRRHEAARAKVERPEMIVEVDVQPLAAGSPSLLDGDFDEPGPDPLPPGPAGDDCVEDERVRAAIPRDVHEPHELASLPGTHPAEAVTGDLASPVVVPPVVSEPLGVERVDFGALERSPPLVDDVH